MTALEGVHAVKWAVELMGGVVRFLDLWLFVTTVIPILEISPNPEPLIFNCVVTD